MREMKAKQWLNPSYTYDVFGKFANKSKYNGHLPTGKVTLIFLKSIAKSQSEPFAIPTISSYFFLSISSMSTSCILPQSRSTWTREWRREVATSWSGTFLTRSQNTSPIIRARKCMRVYSRQWTSLGRSDLVLSFTLAVMNKWLHCFKPIEIPKHEWYYSETTKDLLRYDDGVFEACTAYSPSSDLIPDNPTLFYTHHHLKGIPLDAVPAEVTHEDGYYHLLSKGDPCNIWREVTNPQKKEHHIMIHNKRHLRQASIESGKIQEPIMQRLMEDNGTNDLVQQLYSGELNLETVTDVTIQECFWAIQETATKKHNIPMVQGSISKKEFQEGLKNVDERTTSSPLGLHYT